jgi:hypothetical protein
MSFRGDYIKKEKDRRRKCERKKEERGKTMIKMNLYE